MTLGFTLLLSALPLPRTETVTFSGPYVETLANQHANEYADIIPVDDGHGADGLEIGRHFHQAGFVLAGNQGNHRFNRTGEGCAQFDEKQSALPTARSDWSAVFPGTLGSFLSPGRT